MKFRAFFFAPLVLAAGAISWAQTTEVSIPAVSEAISREEGYQFFTFEAKEERAYTVDLSRNAKVHPILQIMPTKKLIVAVKFGPKNALLKATAYFTNGTASTGFAAANQNYPGCTTQNVIVPGVPFVQLSSPTEKVTLTLTPQGGAPVSATSASAEPVEPALALPDEAFTATSVGTGFSLAGDLAGKISVRARKVTVSISQGKIIRQAWGGSPERKIISIGAFLAEWTPDQKTFQPIARSPQLRLDRVITIGESLSIDGETLEIPINGLSSSQVKNAWLGFSILDENMSGEKAGQKGSCYVHMTTLLNGEPSGFPRKRE